MKIAHIVSTFPPYLAGMGNVVYHLSWQLSRLGHAVTVFTPYSSKPTLDQTYPFSVRRLRPWVRYGNAAFLPQLLWQLRGFDIIDLHYPFFGGAEIIYLRDFFSEAPLVIHYHMDVHGQGLSEKFFRWHTAEIMPRVLTRADAIVVSSLDYALRSQLHNRLVCEPQKFREIPFGVDADTFRPRRKDKGLLDRHGLQNKRIVLFIGALDRAHYFKGITYLIKAFQMVASHDDYRLVIVGTGDLLSSYFSLVQNFGLEKKVIFTGFVANDQLPLYYNVADIVVLPSIDGSEAFGLVLLEAMASGIAVIASDLPGVRSLIEKKVNGFLVKPKDVGTLARYMDWLLRNPQMCTKFGEAGRQKVVTTYDWGVVGRKLEQVYNEFV
ncbi:MAG: glycosyltransferase family 4 protein [Candidatus Komeilibacteria bacterium]